MFFSGGQCGHVGRPEELLLMFKIALVIIFLHITLVTSLEEHAYNSSLLSPSAESSPVDFVPYSNGTPEVETTSLNDATSSVLSTLNKTEKTKITIVKTFNASGVKPQRNICNLSSICNNSAFFRGEIMFQYDEESNITQNQVMANGTVTGILSLRELNRQSELNKTLETLSETYFTECDAAESQSTVNCTFTIKLNKTMNICAVMVAFQTVKIRPMEQCCCSARTPCPSSLEEVKKLQCDLQDPVECLARHPHGPPFSSSSNAIPVAPPATIVSQISSAFSFAEPLAHPVVTQSPHSPTGVIPLPSPQPSAPITSSPAIDMPLPSGTVSSPKPPPDLPLTLSPGKSSAPSPTTSAPVNVNMTGIPPDKTEIVHTSSISVSDLENQVSRMERALSLGSLEPKLAGQMINQVSRLLHSPPTLLAPLAQRLLKVVDDIGLQLNFSTKTISLTSPSLALAVIRVNASNFDTTTFAAQDPANLQVSLEAQAPENSIGVITLPSSLMSHLPADAVELASRVQFNFFETPALFQDPALENLSLISYVISSSVANLTVKNLTRNVTVTLKHIDPSQDVLTVRCVFWDLGRNGGRGGWSSDGCSVKDRRLNETTCTCSHLTSFGVLLDLSRTSLPPAQMMALTFITYIGCGLSSIFLSVTLVTYIAFEKIRRDYPSKILIQLCAALLLLNLVFLLDSWIALYDIRGLCISVAVFLHYFLLVSFTWMGLEAFHMYLALVKVFNTYIRKYILKFCIFGWGIPAVVVAIVLIISPDNYGLGSYGKFPNGSPDDFCWINSNAVFYITVVGYFCVIFLLNISMFIVVLVQLCRIKRKKQLGAQRKTSIQDLRSVAGLTFLLGITWGFAFFAWGPVNVTFMYLFAIFNTLQGFFIFVFYCVAKENVRKQWRRYLCCGKLRLAENSDWSKTATNGLKKQTVNQGVSSSSNSLQSNSNSTHSTTLLVNNDCSGLASGNGNASTEKNGVSFSVQNGDVCLHDFTGKQHIFNEKEDSCSGKNRIALRRTSKRGSLHFIEQM
ncbi:adhesion G-protein coupled receptor G2 isoform X1 [Bos javanicus]|uniref:adhesion G-protein coupled receptor G2 isoform X1 n=1 Tax=Bos javanicus TaxID=9906 RepID=UPI002AA7E89C|nr:adhesion G-protein coupled receptor G2 isoform X1 [Bos javanicus]XP_061263991.1 adhesion G-protein coupled receptor G2 isoform X1 [Bos javanicus]XP_061263992.1 adhesion G-protein coupled receptor G2 isoform X1 [Bos javanicus]XP_061263993.1 adhesion G-protein coupled receptor G2 isoform X1 [Bos javanicus]XP_061263994.1 adhesion G-protein coupled receptor G2 isoform X1 [Bos javanicus]XP_061263995.1 adhesion G-protein coupled receptor G2 isoform X1 [Bos javanicus]XP_061264000.1 adhesion G-pro